MHALKTQHKSYIYVPYINFAHALVCIIVKIRIQFFPNVHLETDGNNSQKMIFYHLSMPWPSTITILLPLFSIVYDTIRYRIPLCYFSTDRKGVPSYRNRKLRSILKKNESTRSLSTRNRTKKLWPGQISITKFTHLRRHLPNVIKVQ